MQPISLRTAKSNREYLNVEHGVVGITPMDVDGGPETPAIVQTRYLRDMLDVADSLNFDEVCVWVCPSGTGSHAVLSVTPRRDSEIGLTVSGMVKRVGERS